MAKVMVPVIRLQYQPADTFGLEAFDVFEEAGLNVGDEHTFTMRVSETNRDEGEREKIRQRLRDALPQDQAQRLIGLLEENDWDVSFFVDAW